MSFVVKDKIVGFVSELNPMGTCEEVKINSYTEGGSLSFTYNEKPISANYSGY